MIFLVRYNNICTYRSLTTGGSYIHCHTTQKGGDVSYENYETFQDNYEMFQKIGRILEKETTGQGKEERSSLSLQDRFIVLRKIIYSVKRYRNELEAYLDYLLPDVERLEDSCKENVSKDDAQGRREDLQEAQKLLREREELQDQLANVLIALKEEGKSVSEVIKKG